MISSLHMKMLTSFAVLTFVAGMATPQGCIPSADGSCESSQDLSQDATSMLQVTQQVSLGTPRDDDLHDAGDKPARPVDAMLQELEDLDSTDGDGDGDAKTTTAGATTTMSYGTHKFGAAAEVTKIKLNSHGDIFLFIGACKFGFVVFGFFVFIFLILLRCIPNLMAFRATTGWIEKDETAIHDEIRNVKETKINETLSTAEQKKQKAEIKRKAAAMWNEYVDTVLMPKDEDGNPKDKDGKKSLFVRGNNLPAPEGARFITPAEASGCCARWFAPFAASYMTTVDDIEENCGLDCAMLIEFSRLSMRLIGYICVPMSMLSLMYIFAGGGAARGDILSWQGVGNILYAKNILPGEEDKVASVQWIWWVLGLVTNLVILFVQIMLHSAQEQFLVRRKRWLKKMPDIQANTVLVRNIPTLLRDCGIGEGTDAAMKEKADEPPGAGGAVLSALDPFDMTGQGPRRGQYDEEVKSDFVTWFGKDAIKSVYVVKKASPVIGAISAYCEAALPIEEEDSDEKPPDNEAKEESKEEKSEREKAALATKEKSKAAYEKAKEYQEKAKEAQQDVIAGKMIKYNKRRSDKKHHSTNAFVTFTSRAKREMAVHQRIAENENLYVMDPDAPSPPPQDITYAQLELESDAQWWYTLLGWGLIIGLFFMFMPIVLFIGQCLSLQSIEQVGFIKSALQSSGFEHTIGGILSSYGLTFMLGWLNFFLMIIINCCFDNDSNTSQQLQLQRIYFFFLIIYVLLITCVGSDIEETIQVVATSPFSIFVLLSNRMPLASHFYMFYVLSQPFTHGMNLCRYMQVFKYLCFYRGLSPDDARYAVEPEDPGYYGVGARSARWELILVIGLVFGTICPLINLCVLWNAVVCRGVYGYLVSCCETVKTNDSGGLHWNYQMRSLQWNLWWYIILMVGIVMHRAESSGPGTLCACSIVVWLVGYLRFNSLRVENLAWKDVMKQDGEDAEPKKKEIKDARGNQLEYNQRVGEGELGEGELFMKGCLGDKFGKDATPDGKAIPTETVKGWTDEYDKNGI